LLYSDDQQQLHQVNQTSAALLDQLRAGATARQLQRGLIDRGVPESTSAKWVETFLRGLSGLALLRAEANTTDVQASVTRHFHLAGVDFSVTCQSGELAELIAAPLQHLECDSSAVEFAYSVSIDGAFVLIGNNGGHATVVERDCAPVVFKGMILEQVLRSANYLFALHAACLSTDGRAILLVGEPGAGKTTLSLELMRRGLMLASDDVTLVCGGNTVRGVPLAPALKETGWDYHIKSGRNISELPILLRPDGQQVRFLNLQEYVPQEALRAAMIVRLSRSRDSRAALSPASSPAVIAELMGGARSRTGKCTPEIFDAIAELVTEAECYELQYSDAASAAAILVSACHG
jgi:hypothetical protein